MVTAIARDSFARGDAVRERVYDTAGCDWCERFLRTPKGRTYLYRYGWRADSLSGTINWQKSHFCSRDCCRAYNGG